MKFWNELQCPTRPTRVLFQCYSTPLSSWLYTVLPQWTFQTDIRQGFSVLGLQDLQIPFLLMFAQWMPSRYKFHNIPFLQTHSWSLSNLHHISHYNLTFWLPQYFIEIAIIYKLHYFNMCNTTIVLMCLFTRLPNLRRDRDSACTVFSVSCMQCALNKQSCNNWTRKTVQHIWEERIWQAEGMHIKQEW